MNLHDVTEQYSLIKMVKSMLREFYFNKEATGGSLGGRKKWTMFDNQNMPDTYSTDKGGRVSSQAGARCRSALSQHAVTLLWVLSMPVTHWLTF